MPDAAWDVVKILIQVLLVTGLGIVGHFLRKTLNHFDARIAKVEDRSQETSTASIRADGRIRETLAREYVDRDGCARRHDETRDTTTRIFTKVEALQTGQAGIEGEMRGLRTAVGGLATGIGQLVAKGNGDGPH